MIHQFQICSIPYITYHISLPIFKKELKQPTDMMHFFDMFCAAFLFCYHYNTIKALLLAQL